MKAKEVQTALDNLKVADRLRDRYFKLWCASTDDESWNWLRAKLGVLDDVLGELRKAVNTEGVDNAKTRT